VKQITNWRNASVSDVESDGLLQEASLLHVLSMEMANGKKASIKGDDHERIKAFFQYHIDNKTPIVGHSFICYDVPLCEKILGMDLSELMVIDSLALSWYLNISRKRHGLDSFLEDYGVEKPKIDDWENLTYEEYRHRCQEDVRINKLLWEDLKERLIDMYTTSKDLIDSGRVGGKRLSSDEVIYLDQFRNNTSVDEWIDKILTFLMYKMDNVRIKEATMWEVDVPKLQDLHDNLDRKIVESKVILESVMPPVPKYVNKNFPKKPIKAVKIKKKDDPKDFTYNSKGEPVALSSSGEKWNDVVSQLAKVNDLNHALVKADVGTPYKVDITTWEEGQGEGIRIKVLNKYEDPNAGSSDQIKALLFSHGWKPQTFEFVDDKPAMDLWFANNCKGRKPKPRAVPQISRVGEDGKELCPSVLLLAEKCPEIMAYQKYTTIKHRRDMVKGWLANLIDGKFLQASCQGFTNTLREKHTGLVNLPGEGSPYWKEIRGSLIAGRGKISLGSDLSSLEDRTKHHFMLPHDPEYVATMMADDYDPHLLTAFSANMITQAEFDGYKMKTLSKEIMQQVKIARAAGKTTNYASVYGAGPPKIALAADIPLDQAKQLHTGYWELNWSVEAIADEQATFKDFKGNMWLVNPVNGFCYSLRTEKDRFSTLAQGTGSFFFDMWVDNILEEMYNRFRVKRLNGLFHDEYISSFKDTQNNRDIMEDITIKSIEKVNDTYLLRRKLGCDVAFGDNYSEIH
jgi:hypothetical protein